MGRSRLNNGGLGHNRLKLTSVCSFALNWSEIKLLLHASPDFLSNKQCEAGLFWIGLISSTVRGTDTDGLSCNGLGRSEKEETMLS